MAQLGSSLSSGIETLSHVLRLVHAFKAFDSDSDGAITTQELGGLMSSLGYNPSEQEVRAMMQRGDKNRDGLLDLEEFLDMNTDESQLGSLSIIMEKVLDSLHVEGDQPMTADDLFTAISDIGLELTLENCQHLISSTDGNGDGAITFEDFKAIINSVLH